MPNISMTRQNPSTQKEVDRTYGQIALLATNIKELQKKVEALEKIVVSLSTIVVNLQQEKNTN